MALKQLKFPNILVVQLGTQEVDSVGSVNKFV